jgi:hypothetical protein
MYNFMIKRDSFFSVLVSSLLLVGLYLSSPVVAMMEGDGKGNDASRTLMLLRAPSTVSRDIDRVATAPVARALTVRRKPLVFDRLLRSEPFPWVLHMAPLSVSPLYEHQRLVCPYQRFAFPHIYFIAEQANPNIFSLFYKGIPLNLFIFETLHTLPFKAIPPHTLWLLEEIARTERSQLIQEIIDEADDDTIDIDPRIRIREAEKQKYPEGRWTTCLPPRYRESLTARLPQEMNLDDINPKFFYLHLSEQRNSLTDIREKCVQLDDQVEKIFARQKRKITPLEDEDTRVDANIEDMVSYMDSVNVDFNKDTVSGLFCPLIDSIERSDQDEMPLYELTLADLDLGDIQVLSFLRGHYLQTNFDVRVEYRNNQWWKKAIHPLLLKRIFKVGKKHPPCLFMYGKGHNKNSYSILKKIMNIRGMSLAVWTRQGWQKWSLKDQVIVPDKLLMSVDIVAPAPAPDIHGRNSWELHFGNLLPNSQLPDKHGRKPGHPLYGELSSDEELRTLALQYGLPADYFHTQALQRKDEKDEKKD